MRFTPTHADPRRLPPALTLVETNPESPQANRVRQLFKQARSIEPAIPAGTRLLLEDREADMLADCGRHSLVRPIGPGGEREEARWVLTGDLVADERRKA